MDKGLNRNKKGFSLTEILVVCSIMLIITAIAIPNFMAARERVQKDTCINNLRQIKLAKEQWALENDKGVADTPTVADLDPYIKDDIQDPHSGFKCPLAPGNAFSASYDINNVGTDPACKICPSTHRLSAAPLSPAPPSVASP